MYRSLPKHYQPLIAPAHTKEKEAGLTRLRHPNRRKRWSFANLEPLEQKLDREKKRGKIRGFIKRMRDKATIRRERKILRKGAKSSEEQIEAEAWEKTKAELFVLFIEILITALMMLSAFNKIFLWHHMSTWNPMWVQWACGVYILISLGIFWEIEWVGLNFLNVYVGFWTFILFIPYDPSTGLTLYDEKGVIGVMPWVFTLISIVSLIIYRGYTWQLNISSLSIGFLFGLILWTFAPSSRF